MRAVEDVKDVTGILLERDVVRVSGTDAASYLQGQISQDLDTVAVGQSAWSLVLEPRGKLVAWFRVTRDADGFLLDLDAGHSDVLTARLERFKLRVDVTITTLTGWRMLAVRGPGSADEKMAAADANAEILAYVRWPGFEGIDLLGPAVKAPDGLAVQSAHDYEVSRISAGWPQMGRELTGRTIPAEVAGLIETSVSFTKGCYTGQELVARIDSRGGRVPRPVRLLEINTVDDIRTGAEIVADRSVVGAVTSAAVDRNASVTMALGLVHRRVKPPASVTVAGKPATVLQARTTR